MALELQAFDKEERIPAILAVLTSDSPDLDVFPLVKLAKNWYSCLDCSGFNPGKTEVWVSGYLLEHLVGLALSRYYRLFCWSCDCNLPFLYSVSC